MANRMPSIIQKHKICIICEGDEEYDYLAKLKQLNVWAETYDVSLENAKGNGNIPARYQDKYQNGSYDVVLVFCDTEKKPYEQYEDIKQKINDFHGVDEAATQVVMFANPCTMQVVVEHWRDVTLKSPAKKTNANIIFECTGVPNYKGRADQRKEILDKIDRENYQGMLHRIMNQSEDDTLLGSSNFGRFMGYFSDKNPSWIKDINDALD